MKMPPNPPAPTADVVGMQVEVCWGNYVSSVDDKTTVKMWCPAKIVRIADGETDKGRDGQPFSNRALKLAPRGMILMEWEPDSDRGETEASTVWYLLDPRKCNGDGHRVWRYHPNALAALAKRDLVARGKAKAPRHVA